MGVMRLSELHATFCRSLLGDNKSAKTARAYGSDFQTLLKFLGKDDLREFTKRRMLDYSAWALEQGYDSNSTYRHLAGFSSFGNWLELREYVQVNPLHRVPRPKRVSRQIRSVPTERADDLLEQVKDSPRQVALFGTMRYAGLRVEELCQLDLEDLGFTQTGRLDAIRVRHGKGDKHRVIPVLADSPLVQILHGWLDVRGRHDGPLFTNYKQARLSRKGVEYHLNKLTGKAGVKGHVTPHQFRHTFGTEATTRYDLPVVQALMGHDDPKTTMLYVDMDGDRLRRLMQR